MHMIFCENIMGPIINQHHLIYSLKWGVKKHAEVILSLSPSPKSLYFQSAFD